MYNVQRIRLTGLIKIIVPVNYFHIAPIRKPIKLSLKIIIFWIINNLKTHKTANSSIHKTSLSQNGAVDCGEGCLASG